MPPFPGPDEDELPSPPEALPEDLREALEAESALYRPSFLTPDARADGGGLSLEAPDLLRLRTAETSAPAWIGGTLAACAEDSTRLFSGEIVHVDPRGGDLFACSGRRDIGELEPLRRARWTFAPFDFARALTRAALAWASDPERLAAALRAVTGEHPSPPRGADFWSLPWTILWGPPGTGKTQLLAKRLAALILGQPDARVLAVAPTNRAADVLAMRVAEEVGAPWMGSQDTCPIFRGGVGVGAELVERFPHVVREPELRKVLRRIDELERELTALAAADAPPSRQAEVRRKLSEERRSIPDPTLRVVRRDRTRLVVTTLHRALGLAAELEGEAPFTNLVVDEAGMVARAAAALVAPLARNVALAGDPRQLGPISQAAEGESSGVRRWLRRSPLSHLDDPARGRQGVDVLKVQHRMHPEVGDVVSRFAYAGVLEHGPGTREVRPGRPAGFPDARAVWLVLDAVPGAGGRKVAHERSELGRGYERPFSAALAVRLARAACEAGRDVLCLTPYRAQAQRLAAAAISAGIPRDRFAASTVHRQQGSQADVVVVDTVAGGRPFPPDELAAMLNVAASRAKEHLFVLASRAEAEEPTVGALLSMLRQASCTPEGKPLQVQVLPQDWERPIEPRARRQPPALERLGDELDALLAREALFTREQLSLFERKVSEGHFLVRGVAGSGKSFVLAQWAVRHLLDHPDHRILVTYFNRGLASMLERLLRLAADRRAGPGAADALLRRSVVLHADEAARRPAESFDAVFVDEAQDFDVGLLSRVYALARYGAAAGPEDGGAARRLKAFLLFADDSQNVYGNRPLEELAEALPDRLSFSGRVRVLREAFRSTREILDLAFNVVLDPKKRHTVANPGMREALHVRELSELGLLLEPERVLEGLFRVAYTERRGVAPDVHGFRTHEEEQRWIASEALRLQRVEGVRPGDLLVVVPSNPRRLAEALGRAGVPAVAYGGKGGEPSSGLKAIRGDHARVTTVFSCKGHESPITFFAGVDALDDTGWLDESDRPRGAREKERVGRSLFYVGATRAMVRLYLTGLDHARFVRVARLYAGDLAPRRPPGRR